MNDTISVRREGAVLEVRFDRPPANALDVETSTALFNAFKQLNDDDALRVGILMAGENEKSVFSAGWDLKTIARGEGISDEEGFDLGPGGLGGLPEYWDLYKPVIAAVNGIAVGGGFEMVLAADIICASDNASFWLPEMQRGFFAGRWGNPKTPSSGAAQRSSGYDTDWSQNVGAGGQTLGFSA